MICATPPHSPNEPTAFLHLKQPVRHSLPIRILRATRVGQIVLSMVAKKRMRNRVAQVSFFILLLILSANFGWEVFSTAFCLIFLPLLLKAMFSEWNAMIRKLES